MISSSLREDFTFTFVQALTAFSIDRVVELQANSKRMKVSVIDNLGLF